MTSECRDRPCSSTALADFWEAVHFRDSPGSLCVIHGWSASRRADHGRKLEVRFGTVAGAVYRFTSTQDAGTDVPGLCCGSDRRRGSQECPAHGGARQRRRIRPASSLHRQRRMGRRTAGEGAARRSGQDGWRLRCVADRRRHGLAEKGGAFGWRRAAIRFIPWKDRQLSIIGLTHPGVARGSGNGGAAALPARELDRQSRTNGASARSRGPADRVEQARDCNRGDRPRHLFWRAFRLRPCRFGLRLQRALPSISERARSIVGGRFVATPECLSGGCRLGVSCRKSGEASQIPHS